MDHAHVPDAELASAGRAAFETLIATLRLCKEAGLLRGEPVEALALSTWAHVHGLTSLLVSGALAGPLGEAPSEEKIIALVGAISWEGLRG